jgi:hypothetical protein
MPKDSRYENKSPTHHESGAPEPERPVPDEEQRRQATPADKPSQAEGERDDRPGGSTGRS